MSFILRTGGQDLDRFTLTLPRWAVKSALEMVWLAVFAVTIAWALLPTVAGAVAVFGFGVDGLWLWVAGLAQLLWAYRLTA